MEILPVLRQAFQRARSQRAPADFSRAAFAREKSGDAALAS